MAEKPADAKIHNAASAPNIKKQLRKFYSIASVAATENGFSILLDGKVLRTPAGAILTLPTPASAEQVAQEWRAQREVIDVSKMPTTRLVNCALDGVAKDIASVRDDLVKYAGSDLVCYRASEPESLVNAQALAFDPIIHFAREKWGARMILGEGVMFVEQPPEAIASIAGAIDAIAQSPDAALKLAALHLMTSLTGSALIALAHAHGALNVEEAWACAHVDDDHQMKFWGRDEEALAARAHKFMDFCAASHLWAVLYTR